MFSLYEVGGKVRDELLGVQSKDVDYTVVPTEELILQYPDVDKMFSVLTDFLKQEGYEIFLLTPDCYTIRAKFPKDHQFKGLVADFVMARKEIGYFPNTRKPILKPGTLFDDLQRRDFTLNAIAKDLDGNLIDYFDGMWALENKILMTPLDAKITMLDDPLRLIRAFRFSITKGFLISPRIMETCLMDDVVDKLEKVVSQERIREEIFKMMKHDTLKSLDLFEKIKYTNPKIMEIIFGKEMWLKPTFEQ